MSVTVGTHFLARINVHDLEHVAVEMRDFDVRRECRHPERDGVATVQQVIEHQRIEDVTHRGSASLDCKDVKLAGRWSPGAHLLDKVLMHNAFGAAQHPVRHRVHAADNALGEFMHECICVEFQRFHAVVK